MSHWNYRVLQSFDRTEYFIAEVYYNDDGNMGWADVSDSLLKWETLEDLQGTVALIQEAFNRPLLKVGEGDNLIEVVDPMRWYIDKTQPEKTWVSENGRWLIRQSLANNNELYHLVDRSSEPAMSAGVLGSLDEAYAAAHIRETGLVNA
ncbi:hypothetical protein JRC04_04710 [Mycolicibacterium sp. S2-37]|uniref:hypothetical protein n=1 Tax=Mycolicibacterium sp. S2-37 TaxID=2810297 RepID=UPI001A943631|nr:hypothetical protein [Mycolicibacterium sp. S2-37]MBO0676760.1 hypothetical protein [Mycolicibacterium sp. S2-37]